MAATAIDASGALQVMERHEQEPSVLECERGDGQLQAVERARALLYEADEQYDEQHDQKELKSWRHRSLAVAEACAEFLQTCVAEGMQEELADAGCERTDVCDCMDCVEPHEEDEFETESETDAAEHAAEAFLRVADSRRTGGCCMWRAGWRR